jgi:hypothetical protein
MRDEFLFCLLITQSSREIEPPGNPKLFTLFGIGVFKSIPLCVHSAL